MFDIMVFTVWKFHDLPITQILREINFGHSKSATSAIFSNLQYPVTLKAKNGSILTSGFSKIDFTKS